MIVRSFQIDEALQLVPVAPESVVGAARGTDARVWIDLTDSVPAEVDDWLDRLGVEGLGRRLCVEARDRAGFYPLKREIFFVLPVLTETEAPGEVDHIAFLCRENLLLTLHKKEVLAAEKLAALEASDSWLSERSIAGLVSALMIDRSLACLQHSNELRDVVFALEQRMDRQPETVEAEEILDLRASLVALGAVVSDQLPSVTALGKTDRPFFRLADAREYMDCALANLQAADGSLSWLDQRVGALRSAFEMNAQEKTNRRLGMLTILSAIFMPITLLAGIWGMNFETMPELGYPFAYPFALGGMALIGFAMYRFFRSTGWFD